MKNSVHSIPEWFSRHALALILTDKGAVRLPLPMLPAGLSNSLLVGVGLLLVALIALLDYETGPYLSFSIFYLIPVALCAWWGGFSHGILLSLAGAVASHYIDTLENPLLVPTIGVWNGIVRFGTLVLTSSLISRLHTGIIREHLLARTDSLTGAANGRTFYEVAATEVERARRTVRPLTLAYLDLDNFKQLNDQLGHAAGDAALVHVVRSIRPHLRGSDVLARLGGDEFALLLPETDAAGASALLTRLQELLSKEMADKGWPVTMSIGAITFLRPLGDVDVMIQRVDSLMYAAKRKGKGRAEHQVVAEAWEPLPTSGGVERRATARVLCEHTARVRLREGEDQEEFATVRDISTGGICLALERRYAQGTLLIVEPLLPGAATLLARVIHAAPEADKWRHGCELSTRLGDEELRRWMREGVVESPCC
jgi:diguanylate cyclase (GGDEF)-like protein